MAKGISPLIASVMLVAMTVAVASIFFGWMSSFTRDTVNTVSDKSDQVMDCQSASIIIDNVYIDTTAKTASVIVRNNGWVSNLSLTSAILYNTTGGNCTLDTTSLDSKFDKSDIATIKFTECPITTCPNDFKKAIVNTNCGSVDAEFDSSPVCS